MSHKLPPCDHDECPVTQCKQTLTDTLQRFKHHCKTCDFCRHECHTYKSGPLWLCREGRAILMVMLDAVFGD